MAGSIQYLIIVPLAAAFLIPLFAKKARAMSWVLAQTGVFIITVLSFMIALSIRGKGVLVYNVGHWPVPSGISLVVDSLSAFILIIANFVMLVIVIYSNGYIKKYSDTWKHYSLLMLVVTGVNGVLVTGDIFNMYVFLEIASIAIYALFAFGRRKESFEAAFKYAVMSTVASIFILLGIAVLYSRVSTLNMADIALVLSTRELNGGAIKFVTVLFLMGFGLKSALVPFHTWLPDAYSESPATVPAISSGILIKVLGVYALCRILFNVFGMQPAVSHILLALAVMSMVLGGVMAFGQKNIRRLLGYSSISQIGYIFLGLGIGTKLALVGSLLHILNHSVAKSLLFLNVGTLEDHSNVARRPVNSFTALVGSMSICGVPPTGGFWSKLIIILACIEAGHIVLALVAVAVGVLTLAYYFRALTPLLFRQVRHQEGHEKENTIPFSMGIAVVILAVISVISGVALLPNAANELLIGAVNVLSGGVGYASIVLGALV
ncbi:MAG: proton-conducting transporter membrane subunit [Candidatus Omnitrophota bacterium]|jgi:multicomponent Na+:H+ antiporter subunit D